ncbi:MAG: SDR family NAD(P)-dependent oxidoreductase [Cetobacterium sp.]
MKKIAVVTASTKGIGASIGKKFLENGYRVIFNYSNNENDAMKLKNDLQTDYGDDFEIIKSDMSTPEGVYTFSKIIKEKYENIDALVLNTAITNRKNLSEISYEEYVKVIDTNLNLPFLLVKELKSNIKERGNIIFIGAVMGIYPHAMSIPYAVSKAGLRMLAESLVKEFKHQKIRVNTVAPGFIETPWQKEKPEDQKNRICAKIALQRFGTPDEIGDLCYYITTNDYINGATLRIDGGYNME